MKPWHGTTSLMAAAWMAAEVAGADLVVTGATNRIWLKPNQPGQQVRLFLENRTSNNYPILAGTFLLSVEPSAPGLASPLPRISQARMVGLEGSPLVESRLMQTDYPAPAGSWMSLLESVSFLPGKQATIQAGSRWPLCDVELDTTGVQDGSIPWQIRFDGIVAGVAVRSFFNVPSDEDPSTTLEVPVVSASTEILVESSTPLVLPPVAVRLGAEGGILVFEADAAFAAKPRFEFSQDPVAGAWTAVNVSGTQVGSKWRWEVPINPGVPARFFRTSFGVPGAPGGAAAAK